MDPFLCTHIMYSFYFISKKQQLQSTAPNDADLIKRTLNLKKKNKHLVIMLSVGGANPQASPGQPYLALTNTPDNSFIVNAYNEFPSSTMFIKDNCWPYF